VGFTALMRASDKGHAAAAAALIEMGADVNLRWGFETPPAVPQ
jgi:ankyrin repeat protein